MLRLELIILFCISALAHYGQNVTVINKYLGEEKDEIPDDYVLKSVVEHTYIINEYELSTTSIRSKLEQMMSYGLRSFIDENYHVYNNRVEALTNSKDFLVSSANIVENALWIHEQPFVDDFPGFSSLIAGQIKSISEVDGYKLLSGDKQKSLPQNNEIGLYTFQRMVYDLKKSCELEVRFFLDKHLPSGQANNSESAENINYLFYDEFKLEPIDNNLEELKKTKPVIEGLTTEEETVIPVDESKKDKKKRKADSELTERVVELLEQNSKILNSYNDRFEFLQKQIDDVRSNPNKEIRDEINQLRTAIENLADSKSGNKEYSFDKSKLSAEDVVIVFEKNIHDLALSQKAVLNRVFMALKANPGSRAFITGYADKSGNPELNAWISQKRAEAVSNYLKAKGVESKRLIISFLGDVESDSVNPFDRKVTVSVFEN